MVSYFHLSSERHISWLNSKIAGDWTMGIQHGAILTRNGMIYYSGMFMNVIRGVLGSHYSPVITFTLNIPAQNTGKNTASCLIQWPYILISHLTRLWFPKDLMRDMPSSDPLLLTMMQDTLQLLNQSNTQHKV